MFRFPTLSDLRSRANHFWTRSLTNKLVVACVLLFVAQKAHLFFADAFALNPIFVKSGFWLNFLTYGFLHGNFWHVALNMLVLYFCGNSVEKYEARGNVLAVFLGGIVVGGLAWFAAVAGLASNLAAQTLVGASAGIAALFAYFSIANRDADIRAMLFFVVPVQMRAWVLFFALFVLSALGFVFLEWPSLRGGNGQSALQTIAHSAHLGGLIFGAIYALVAEKMRSRNAYTRTFR